MIVGKLRQVYEAAVLLLLVLLLLRSLNKNAVFLVLSVQTKNLFISFTLLGYYWKVHRMWSITLQTRCPLAFRHLRHLDVSHNRSFHRGIVTSIVEGLPFLRFLVAHNCRNVS